MLPLTTHRDTRIDALRGLFLVIMAAVHVPTPLSHWLHEPFGYIGSAEGFVFLSGGLAGLVYGKIFGRDGWHAMAHKVWRRAGKVYAIHLSVLLPIALLAWELASHVTSLEHHFHDFLLHPWRNLALMPLLAHQPPLFDILPLYVGFLGITPLVLSTGRRYGWGCVLVVSFLIWGAAQFSEGFYVPGHPHGLRVMHSGPFDLRAWQFLWVSGLALGQGHSTLKANLLSNGTWRSLIGGCAAAVVLIGLLSRHGLVQTPNEVYVWLNKWSLGPLRLINFGAWVVLFLAWNPRVPKMLTTAPALLGRQSLAVFSAHLPLVIGANCVIQWLGPGALPKIAVGLVVVAVLFPVAYCAEHWSNWFPAMAVRSVKPAVPHEGSLPLRTGELRLGGCEAAGIEAQFVNC